VPLTLAWLGDRSDPEGKLPRFSSYVVERGDSLWKISRKAYGSGEHWAEIQAANALVLKKGTTLYRGQKLHIPAVGAYKHSVPRGVSGVTPPHLDASAPLVHMQPATIPPGTAAMNGHGELSLSAATKSGPFERAKPILFPAFKYDVDGMKMEADTPVAHYEAKFTGELTMQQEGVITGNVTFTKEGVELEYKKGVDTKFNEMFTKATPKIDFGKRSMTMELGVGGSAKMNGQVMYTTETTIVPPATLKFTYKPREIKGTYKGFEFAGVIGYEFTVTPKTQDRFNPHTVPSESVNWKKVTAVGLVALAAVIVVADVVKDVGTLGAGTVESPLSFAAAAELFGEGMAIFRTAAVVAP